ncbi:MAG: hypothetical protein ACTSUE_11705 [Promethearchaeota archaeon]
MSDDEFDDDEEYEPKKSKIPIKSVLKALGIMVFVVAGMLLMNQGFQDPSVYAVGFILICTGSCLMNLPSRKKRKVKHVYSIYKCNASGCGIKELHEFKDGDYVFKRIGPCWKCEAGVMEISQIFSVEKLPREKIKISEPDRPIDPIR